MSALPDPDIKPSSPKKERRGTRRRAAVLPGLEVVEQSQAAGTEQQQGFGAGRCTAHLFAALPFGPSQPGGEGRPRALMQGHPCALRARETKALEDVLSSSPWASQGGMKILILLVYPGQVAPVTGTKRAAAAGGRGALGAGSRRAQSSDVCCKGWRTLEFAPSA